MSSFRSRDDVIETMLVSSHIPYWFDGEAYQPGAGGGGSQGWFAHRELCHLRCAQFTLSRTRRTEP